MLTFTLYIMIKYMSNCSHPTIEIMGFPAINLCKVLVSLASQIEWETYTKNNKTNNSSLICAEHIYNEGPESVYLYYFPLHQELANLKSEPFWRCKIGKASDNAIERIIEQMHESTAEIPIVPYIIKCNNGLELERNIHKELFKRKRHIKDAMGSEWFLTNPNEFFEIVSALKAV